MDTQAISLALFLDLALRGAAAGISLLIAGQLLAFQPRRAVTVFGALFAVGAAVYSIVLIEPVLPAIGPARIPVKLFAMLSPAFFWLFIMALFDDGFHSRRWMAAPLLAIAVSYAFGIAFADHERAARLVHVGVVLVLMGHVLWLTHGSLGDDLVAARRSFTTILIALVPLVCLAIGIIEVYELLGARGRLASTAIAALLFAVSSAFGFGLAGIRASLLPQPAEAAPRPDASVSAADRVDLARLEKLMADGIYLQTGLTIGELAGRMDMPEHRLRRLINKGLGYRNFAAFINDHRIEEAKRRLSAPETAREQITSLAFELGYSSLAPFNRAFRERVDMSPSQFREKALHGA